MAVHGPLAGITVLDVSRVLAGPFCTMILGDLGAEVIKVEPPTGDDTRLWGPPFIGSESAYYLSTNRNKKGIVLDLKNSQDKERLLKLARKADVFIENFRLGVAESLGIDYESIKAVNPNIIYCSIKAFGSKGPYADKPGLDIVIQAYGGFMGITGTKRGTPVRVGVAITDLTSGLYAVIGILSALLWRTKSSEGQFVELSLLDCSVSLMTYMAQYYFATNTSPRPMGSEHPQVVPYQAFRTMGGKYIIIGVSNDKLWTAFCKALDLEKLIAHPRYATNPLRIKNRRALIPIIQKRLLKKTRDEWMKILDEHGVPCGPVYSMAEIFSDPQVLHNNMLVEIEHPTLGRIRQVGTPLKYEKTPPRIRLAPPLLGQHTSHIIKSLE